MKKTEFIDCRTSVMSKVNCYAAVFLYPFVGVVLLFCGLFLIGNLLEETTLPVMRIIVTVFIIGLTLFASYILFWISVKVCRFEKRKIALDQCGVIVRDREDRRYLWDQLSGIGIVAFSATANRQDYDTQVCIFLKPIDARDLKKLRDSYLYGARNLDKFILVDYDSSLDSILSQYYSLPLTDFRTEQLHK